MYPEVKKTLEIIRRIIALLEAEELSRVAAEEILGTVLSVIRKSALVEGGSQK